MRTGKKAKLHILLLTVCLLLVAWPAYAKNEEPEPLTLTVEADPTCLLSEAGEMTFFRFKVKNNLNEEYVLEDMSLQGDILSAPKLISNRITIKANDVLEFTLENVRIEDFMFDMDLSFQLTWWTTSYTLDGLDNYQPISQEHMISAPIRIERFVEPVMALSVAPDVTMAREGDPVTVTYTLINNTKFDMTNITLQDDGIPQYTVPLERNILNAGEQMQANITFPMGDRILELNPTVQYTVRGIESKVSVTQAVTVEYVDVELRMEVEKYPATAEGTLFRITLINNGSHAVTDIRITDEIGTLITEGISLKAGKERTISYTVPSAVSSGSVRYISFEATALDNMGGLITVKSPSAYELLPFVDSGQVKLYLSVTLTSSDQTDDGSNRLKLLFEVRNDSQVPIYSAMVTESDYFKGIVNEYPTLAAGTTSFEKEFIVPAGTRSLTFVLTAVDPAQTQYASVPITLDLSPLAAPRPTNPPAIKPGKTVDTTGTIYDTERYTRILRMASLIVLALTLVFLLLSVIFRVAELNTRRLLPKETPIRPFGPRRKRTSSAPIREAPDPVHVQFGYMQPAKLRYMERTDRIPTVRHEEPPVEPKKPVQVSITASVGTISQSSRTTSASRRAGEITAVPIHKAPKRLVMMSSDDTMPFAPVHEDKVKEAATTEKRTEPPKSEAKDRPAATPRVIEVKPDAGVLPRKKLEIVHVLQP